MGTTRSGISRLTARDICDATLRGIVSLIRDSAASRC